MTELTRGRVLIIDDVENVGVSLKRLLSHHHEVDCFFRAREALEALTEGRRWDIILCDLSMPEMDGMQFVAALEAAAPALVPHVILMTGGAFTTETDDFLRQWPYGRIEKPASPQRLIDEVDRAVARARGA